MAHMTIIVALLVRTADPSDRAVGTMTPVGTPPAGEAVLLTGVYGVGKTTIAIEIADVLERGVVPFAALDLDWLTWCNAGAGDRHGEHEMMLRNLDSVMVNYRAAGVRHYVLARSIFDRDELMGLTRTMAMPTRTVEITLPFDEISRRLATDPTSGRRDDLSTSGTRMVDGAGTGFADRVVVNDQPVRVIALDILRWLGWRLPR